MPATHAFSDSWTVKIRCTTESAIPTMHPAMDPQRSVTKGSAAPKMSHKSASAPAEARPDVYSPPRTTRMTVMMGIAALYHRGLTPSGGVT